MAASCVAITLTLLDFDFVCIHLHIKHKNVMAVRQNWQLFICLYCALGLSVQKLLCSYSGYTEVLASSGLSRRKSRSCFPLRPYLHCTQAYCLCRVPLRAHLHHAQAYCLCHVPLWPHLHREQAYCLCHVPLRAHLHHAQAYCLCNGTVHRPTDTDV